MAILHSDSSKRIVFFGSSSFSLPPLHQLIGSDFNVVAVVTQPDKPHGRHKRESENIVKSEASKLGLPIVQPEFADSADFLHTLNKLHPDLFIVVSYGKILPKQLLAIPNRGSINIHASLLPKYRGASPIQSAILNDEKNTGVCLMLMDEQMDTGPILAKKEIPIDVDETSVTLEHKLATLGALLLTDTLPNWFNGNITPTPQPSSGVSYCKKITKEHGKIDWNIDAFAVERKVRAYTPWPSAWTNTNDAKNVIKIIKGVAVSNSADGTVGSIFMLGTKIAVKCGKNTALILEIIQPSGKKPMSAEDYLRGHKDFISTTLI